MIFTAGCSDSRSPEQISAEAAPDLKAHSAEFKKEVIKVTDGVWVAVGFGLANSILLEGNDGVVIVDTMESAEAAAPVKAAFDKISSKPVKAIIYTHYHTDHIFGARVMAGEDRPEVICQARTLYCLNRIATITRETTYRRAMRQFGTMLPPGGVINDGIGPRLEYDQSKTIALLLPTRTFAAERMELDVAGLKLVLVHAPGETPDQIFIWLPRKKVLLPADNYYNSFPNLYAIRGTAYRDVMGWVNSLDKMRALKAEYLVPSHTRPLDGAERIYETLTNYRDAIQFVHDQTIRLMNRGLTPQQIVERVRLPAHLAGLPYLQEYYGTVEWSVRAVFDGYLGWFGGNASDLFPLPLRQRAMRFARMVGGETALLEKARQAVAGGDYQWALELTDHLLQLDYEPDKVRTLRATALKALAEMQIASTARNYYLTRALEVTGELHIPMMNIKDKALIHQLTLEGIFRSMAVRLDPEKSAHVDTVAGFRFPDTGQAFTVHVRRGVAEIHPWFPDKPDLVVTVDSNIWKEIAAGVRNPALAIFKDLKKEGGTLSLIRFLRLFKST
ncbi:MAG: MBL fold metallo-hydrolase [Deltaproteobacteria bacterium]|nr:MBL fold metallo-hydrolase [Deltaproteobacteria bacterium]MBW2048587.1 MBL fold metallo-hydrolase [Deltaproteobacteria bacterium]MBW2111875.1 MBL fold metallo-hydrolase [Deltaproteobacteria bacterium]MBW2353796.1 MBL fold metallo-hydrolase [Deltaproteobacteria bacterium]